nr:arginine repressor [uncultured Blautia sp.]
MKVARHEKIKELIQQYDIDTQEELASRLNEAGFKVTQATVSRDIRALKMMKVTGKDGKSRYVILQELPTEMGEKYTRVLHDALLTIDQGQNILVIRTVPGMAMGVAAALDALSWEEILGSIAGDDTVMCVARTLEEASSVAERLKSILQK